MADRSDATVLLPNIGVPALVITSAEDTLIPPDATREMAEDIPNTDFEIIEGAGHLSNFEAPGEFNALLRRFIERVGPIA
jgi:pimeloyl-ACP methyl ester carboxylesterase